MSGDNSTVFVTGGAGYVGSHSILELLKNGYDVVAVDNYSNSSPGKDSTMPESLKRVQSLTGKSLTFYQVDLLNKEDLRQIFLKHTFSCVIHFAALKAVGESCRLPLGYYRNNVGGSVNLLEVMQEFNVKKMVFSSSATVYGIPEYLPLDESHPVGSTCTNPYGRTKYFIEEILKDVCKSEKGWSVILLRYFNPVGAHESGVIGEDPNGIPNNLMPFIAQVAVGRLKELQVFGNDYKTVDGTGVRDYIHVMDLAEGHVAAVNEILKENFEGCKGYNLGTGEGYSVLQVIHAFEDACGVKIPYKIVGRREGDVDSMYADVSLAEKCLGWKSKRSLEQMSLNLTINQHLSLSKLCIAITYKFCCGCSKVWLVDRKDKISPFEDFPFIKDVKILGTGSQKIHMVLIHHPSSLYYETKLYPKCITL